MRYLTDEAPAEEENPKAQETAGWRAAIPSHHTGTVNGAWDGPGTVAAAPDDPAVLRYMHGWYSGENPDQKGSYKFPHHSGKIGSPANMNGVRNGLARLQGSSIPDADKAGVERHLRRHLEDGGGGQNEQLPPWVRDGRAKATEPPAGKARMLPFPCELRGKVVTRNGKKMYEVEGYASVFEAPYIMYDMFGPYREIVDKFAFTKTMAKSPDVAFLTNHKGVTMARTTNGSLELYTDSTGLGAHGFLNAERQDVRDLMSAIDDKLVTEMSFAFMLDEGKWNEEMTEFRLLSVDIDRGDVSAVNYGANPYTSITARSTEWLAEAEQVPASVARAALDKLSSRKDLYDVETVSGDDTGEPSDSDRSSAEVSLEYNSFLLDLEDLRDEEELHPLG